MATGLMAGAAYQLIFMLAYMISRPPCHEPGRAEAFSAYYTTDAFSYAADDGHALDYLHTYDTPRPMASALLGILPSTRRPAISRTLFTENRRDLHLIGMPPPLLISNVFHARAYYTRRRCRFALSIRCNMRYILPLIH